MSYLKLNRTRTALACFFISSLIFWLIPEIDIRISRFFFDRTPDWKHQFLAEVFHRGIGYFVCASLVSLLGIYLFNRFANKNMCGMDGKKALYPLLVLIVGAGLIVNVVLKDNFGRARPRDIEEFGGSKQFTPAFVVSRECDHNCSFSSGDGAAGFYALSLAIVVSRKRRVFLAASMFGCVVSYFRLASGAHFFSDIVVSFFIMFIVSDFLHHHMFLPKIRFLGFVGVSATSAMPILSAKWIPATAAILPADCVERRAKRAIRSEIT